uniref:Uncharacterized protein n=1 Tax=Nelumbo nucifera TaxID=4432 RepID=A0A822YKD3_NELNU|nr:TPA_asm: hypothetical protein HUJ06_011911 [Nelumbo nucifera]
MLNCIDIKPMLPDKLWRLIFEKKPFLEFARTESSSEDLEFVING